MNKYLNLLVLLIISSSIAFEPTQEVNYGIPTTKIFYDDEGNQYNETTDPSTGFTFTKIIKARSPNVKANIVVKDSNGNIIPTNSVYSKNTPNSPNYIPSQEVTDKNGNIVQTSFNPEMNTLTT